MLIISQTVKVGVFSTFRGSPQRQENFTCTNGQNPAIKFHRASEEYDYGVDYNFYSDSDYFSANSLTIDFGATRFISTYREVQKLSRQWISETSKVFSKSRKFLDHGQKRLCHFCRKFLACRKFLTFDFYCLIFCIPTKTGLQITVDTFDLRKRTL